MMTKTQHFTPRFNLMTPPCPLRWRPTINKALLTILSVFYLNNAYADNLTYVDKHLGNNKIQGLKYIKDAAHAHMARYNKKYRTKWVAYEPDTRTLLTKCAVPLKTNWYKATQSDVIKPVNNDYWYIKVSCARTVKTLHKNNEGWYEAVPTNRPIKKAVAKK